MFNPSISHMLHLTMNDDSTTVIAEITEMPRSLFTNIPRTSSVNYQIRNTYLSRMKVQLQTVKVLNLCQFHVLVHVKKKSCVFFINKCPKSEMLVSNLYKIQFLIFNTRMYRITEYCIFSHLNVIFL